MNSDARQSIGIVVIGRNEGDRLRQCLTSLVAPGNIVVYVDSGSTDGSVDMARDLSADVVELNTEHGFTAARARNAGFERLVARSQGVEFVQFLDGDCVLDSAWIDRALQMFGTTPRAAVVCGRRRERNPNSSVYNRLCDFEWNTPVGTASECGGDAMMRVEAFRKVKGFDENLIAGEEPELCVRLRAAGWTIQRIDAEMTLHDAAMNRFGQWWNRNLRAGHAFAQGSAMHGSSPLKHWVRQTRSNWVWGLAAPTAALLLAYPTRGLSLVALLGMYLLLTIKIFLASKRSGKSTSDAKLFAAFCVIGKCPQAIGQLRYYFHRFAGMRSKLIEYKDGSTSVVSG